MNKKDNVQVVVNLTELSYRAVNLLCISDCGDDFHKAIALGKVVPKGHKIIDADAAIKELDDFLKKQNVDIRDNTIARAVRVFLRNYPAIADMGETNEK